MIDIIIAGYPKSGNTWVTRLVAELVGCPVAGFWNSSKINEIAREGQERESQYQCFKSHDQWETLSQTIGAGTDLCKVIYVIRDPRDACLSGSHFFKIERCPLLNRLINKVPLLNGALNNMEKRLISTPRYRLERMINAVLHGDARISKHLKASWKSHVMPYIENNCFSVRYEDILDDPLSASIRILQFLELNRDADLINAAIRKQSFQARKSDFQSKKDDRNFRFLRKGAKEQWKQDMTDQQRATFRRALSAELSAVGYEIA